MQIYNGNGAFGKTEVALDYPESITVKCDLFERKFRLGFRESAAPSAAPYLGYTESEVVGSGRDILGEKILAGGFPTRERLRGALPPIAERASYAVLGSEASWSGFSVSPLGEVCLQEAGAEKNGAVLFSVNDTFPGFFGVKPEIWLLDGDLPLLSLSYEAAGKTLLLFYVCEPQDPDRTPVLWTMAALLDGDRCETKFQRASASREKSLIAITGGDFFEIFLSSVSYFTDELDALASFSLPDEKLQKDLRAAFSTAFTTFAGDHPHYGHRFYGRETHDYFPPTFLSYIETMLLYGNISRARRTLEHILCHAFDSFGRLAYRQGEEEVSGVSASEYGQFFVLLENADSFPEISPVVGAHLEKLRKTAKMLVSTIRETKEYPSLKLISMCAEADTNGRIHIYAQNNLWAVRGLSAFAKLLARRGDAEAAFYEKAAGALLSDLRKMLDREKVASVFGPLVPFRAGYPALPYNLSGARDTSVPLSDEEFAAYCDTISWVRADFDAEKTQDFLENSYANYRYYPEMLSAALLSEEEERAIEALRRNLGGEVLGMTRLWKDGIDDWPVVNMANFLLRTGQKDRFWLLLYAHLLLHGEEEKGIWYEQRAISGGWTANDCVPSLLTVPLMLGRAFVSESPKTGETELLKGVPDEWFSRGFSARGLYARGKKISVRCENGTVFVSVSDRANMKVYAPEGYRIVFKAQ